MPVQTMGLELPAPNTMSRWSHTIVYDRTYVLRRQISERYANIECLTRADDDIPLQTYQ